MYCLLLAKIDKNRLRLPHSYENSELKAAIVTAITVATKAVAKASKASAKAATKTAARATAKTGARATAKTAAKAQQEQQ